MDNKRKRAYLERACKRACKKKREDSEVAENAIDPLYLDPKLWSKLPPELANRVLSYVPIHRLIDILLRVDRRWAKLLRSTAFFQMFGRGNNLNSSYGIVMLDDPKVPRLMGFEEESQQWLLFSKKLHPEMKKARVISLTGSTDGLILCESRRNLRRAHLRHHIEIGVWNPLFCSFKWLPESPFCNSYFSHIFYAVMVHEPCRTYRVFHLHNSTKFYSVYDSTTGSWRSRKRMPAFFNYNIDTWRRVASCDRYIFLQGFQTRFQNNLFFDEYFIYWYDAEMDSWDRIFVSEILQKLGVKADNVKNPPFVENFVILHGVLYMLIRMVHTNEERSGVVEGKGVCFLASMDLSALGVVEFGAARSTRFKFEAFAPDAFQVPEGRRLKIDWACRFNLYCYTMKGNGYIGVQTSKYGHFLHYDVSKGDWSKHDKSLEGRVKNWDDQFFFHFKPSFVVP